jgi:hypothetical protein
LVNQSGIRLFGYGNSTLTECDIIAIVTTILIHTENPKAEQWRRLARFNYPLTIERFLTARSHSNPDEKLVNFVAGCFRQAEAYFVAGDNAPLDIAPLLLYYGATNLLAGAAALLTGEHFAVRGHGMTLNLEAGDRCADVLIIPKASHGSGLPYYAQVFSSGCDLHGGARWAWTLEEVLASIPDLKSYFESCYEGSEPFAVPVRIIRKARLTVERVYSEEVAKHQNPQEIFDRIVGLQASYLPIQRGSSDNYMSLHPRKGSADIGVYSIMGQKNLVLAHRKNNELINPDQIILLLMGLFALGHLSRYYPERWNPFVRRDDTGERLVVEQFLEICQRYLPNLVLNRIEGTRLQFVHDIESPIDETSTLTTSDVEEIARRVLRSDGR